MSKNLKQANINIHLKDLFLKWLEITSAFHNLTRQQKRVLSLLLYYHYKFKSEVTNTKILWKLVFDYDTKFKIREELGMKDSVLQNVLTKLRKDNIITNNVISPAFIPDLEPGSKMFRILFNFNIIHE